ncbi:hypothetical protein PINS_up024361, partial [Pythium insidiosum]
MTLWSSSAYQTTGTLFFTDRISYDASYLASVPGRDHVSFLHDFMASFDVAPFRALASLPRAPPSPSPLARFSPFRSQFSFEPKRRAAAEPRVDAARRAPNGLVARALEQGVAAARDRRSSRRFSRSTRSRSQRSTTRRQQTLRRRASRRALAAPSYGDKELYFLACELAETQYAFTPHAVATIGTDVRLDAGDRRSVLCGDALHYVPTTMRRTPRPLYINSDDMLSWDVDATPLYRSVARPASLFRGPSRLEGCRRLSVQRVGAGADTSAGRS